jgi:hypothetical protein
MKHLKKYRIFESTEQDLSDIRDCFLSVNDMTHVKISKSLLHNIEVSIGLSHIISRDESGTSKWGVKYKELINGNEIAEETANSISICMGMGFKVIRAEVSWVNAGEWKLANPDKEGTGPGLLTKIFQEGSERSGIAKGQIGPMDMINQKVTKARYSPEILPDFIVDKGTRLRHIKIVFSK